MPLPLPVTVITGFLGSGKTTLINRLLAGDHGLRLAVLVNDFGEIALDASLIESEGDGLLTLANGCMCCQIGGALYDTIDRIIRSADLFDHMVIETSGVADPNPIAQIAIAEPDLAFHQTVTLVDAVNAGDVRGNPRLADTWERQVRGADLIVVTKGELVDAAVLDGLLADLREEKASRPVIDVAGLDDLSTLLVIAGAPVAADRSAYGLSAHGEVFASWSWQGEGRVDMEDVKALLVRDDLGIYRAKGRVETSDGWRVVHKVGRQLMLTSCDAMPEEGVMVFIGPREAFDRMEIESRWGQVIDNG